MPQSSDRLRIIFAGTPDFAAHHLAALITDNKHDIVAVYTQPDRPAGRGKKLSPSPVKQLALDHQLPVLQPASLKTPEAQQEMADFQADLMVVVAYGLLLPKAILETPRLGCINVHASLLPRWRGAAPIQRAVEAGDKETGITIMQMDEGLDTGDMLITAHIAINPEDTGGSLHDKLAAAGPAALHKALAELATGCAVAEKQDDALSNYAPKITKAEAAIDWQQSAAEIDRKIRAFNPFPVAFTELANSPEVGRVRIWSGYLSDRSGELPTGTLAGTIIEATENGLLVACGKEFYRITELQLPGKKRLPVSEVLKSRAELFKSGALFSSAASAQ
jgi:methionyl-tRNA formyltransferase